MTEHQGLQASPETKGIKTVNEVHIGLPNG